MRAEVLQIEVQKPVCEIGRPQQVAMVDEGDDLEAIYVCVKFTLTCESLSTVPRGPPRLTNKRKIYTYVMGLARFNRNTPIRVQAGEKTPAT